MFFVVTLEERQKVCYGDEGRTNGSKRREWSTDGRGKKSGGRNSRTEKKSEGRRNGREERRADGIGRTEERKERRTNGKKNGRKIGGEKQTRWSQAVICLTCYWQAICLRAEYDSVWDRDKVEKKQISSLPEPALAGLSKVWPVTLVETFGFPHSQLDIVSHVVRNGAPRNINPSQAREKTRRKDELKKGNEMIEGQMDEQKKEERVKESGTDESEVKIGRTDGRVCWTDGRTDGREWR